MKAGLGTIAALCCCLTGCALHHVTQTTTAQAAPNHVRILPNTAVIICRTSGPHCDPPSTTTQTSLSGSVDAFGNVHIDDPSGLPPR